MTSPTASFELYGILIEQGIDEARAKAAVDAFLTREKARLSLATKDDIRKLIMWIAVMMVGQLAANAAITERQGSLPSHEVSVIPLSSTEIPIAQS